MTKKYISLSVSLLFCCLQTIKAADIHGKTDPNLKRFINSSISKNSGINPINFTQNTKWKSFNAAIGKTWQAEFTPETGMPHRAFGSPVDLGKSLSTIAAGEFIQKRFLGSYINEKINLRLAGTNKSPKYSHINYIQQYNGLDILWSRVMLKLSVDNSKLVALGLDIHDDVNISIVPMIAEQNVESLAGLDLLEKSIAENKPTLKILPISTEGKYSYKLVYEIILASKDEDGTPARYYTLMDANDGKIYYRSNKVQSFAADVTTKGVIYPKNPYTPTGLANLPYTYFTVSGLDYATDVTGFSNLTLASPTLGTFKIEGDWAKIFRGTSKIAAPSFSKIIRSGINSIPYDSIYTIRDLSAYYHTTIIHDYLKTKFPEFADYDFQLPVNIDRTDGTCNAFFDGASVNYYTTAGGCNALSMVADVIYHEYGHGITNYFWDSNGLNFDNGGMGEGYSDIWAISITNDPVLGIGFSSTDPTDYVRRYDINKKVFPQNLVGQVHADGEIIAGCWWDLALNLSSTPIMSDIFAESHFGLANGPNGAEKQVYSDIFLDALFADDNDNDLTNGTPNFTAIVDAFALHGITFLTSANLNHTPINQAIGLSPIAIQVSITNLLNASSLNSVKVFYQVNNSGTWLSEDLTNGGSGTSYAGDIPGQVEGSIIKYYVAMLSSPTTIARSLPFSAEKSSNPNLPYFIKVGFTQTAQEDFDLNQGTWTTGLLSDNATTGKWIIAKPILSGTASDFVQPGFQNSVGGTKCAVTGNGTVGGGIGDNDVDGGKTTLQSPVYDLSLMTNPVFSYFRFYTNDQGATPGTDFWKVQISNDGTTWVDIENTNVADHSFRENVIRVSTYVAKSSTVSLRFIAEDANAGSLVEALVDDLTLHDASSTVGLSSSNVKLDLKISPNPANEFVLITFPNQLENESILSISDYTGKIVLTQTLTKNQITNGEYQLPILNLINGLYVIKIQNKDAIAVKKLTVMH